jgi:AcrR family transcriptional regulator
MSRWKPGARGRLQQAAIELFGEQGFEHTTVAEIAERAGLTERTFFRYFEDKREVLFEGADELRHLLEVTVADAPQTTGPLATIEAGLDAVGGVLENRKAFARQRQRVITANAELRERELIKLSSWSDALAEALRRRGVAPPVASLTAEVAMAVFRTAFARWIEESGDRRLGELIADSFDELRALSPTP